MSDIFTHHERAYEEEGGRNSEIYRIPDRPGHLLKIIKLPDQISSEAEIKEHFENEMSFISTYFGDDIPRHEITYREHSGRLRPVIDTEEVIRTAYQTSPESKANFYRQLDAFLKKCCRVFETTLNPATQEGLVPDLTGNGFAFGTTASQPIPRLFLVDFYPTILCKSDRLAELVSGIINQLPGDSRQFFQSSKQGVNRILNLYQQ